MIFLEKVWHSIAYHNDEQFVPDSLRPCIMARVERGLLEISTHENPTDGMIEDEFDEHSTLLFALVAPFVLEVLDKIAPKAWFKPIFMPKDKQRELGLPV